MVTDAVDRQVIQERKRACETADHPATNDQDDYEFCVICTAPDSKIRDVEGEITQIRADSTRQYSRVTKF
ncbi:unnamed protein product [Cylicostephanus goldi]|uniref:Uncharacterized protein n=1 Tax=Cylicostephanus goldi TaxID=71465 RepID=A0A3P6SST9_CYLGO|nr:unnamed protein product [Cylicostephanus goldi]